MKMTSRKIMQYFQHILQYIFFSLFLLLIVFAQENRCQTTGASIKSPYGKIAVKTWYQDKKAAYSLTFDDGTLSHYTTLYPLLNKYGLKATFYIIGNSLADTGTPSWRFGYWKDFRKMAEYGHEIGAHSMTHPHMNELEAGDTNTAGTLFYEIYKCKQIIEEKITNQKCLTFGYPFCEHNSLVDKITAKYYEAARDCDWQPNNSSIAGMQWMGVNSSGISFADPGKTIEDDMYPLTAYMKTVQERAFDKGKWAVFIAHEVISFKDIKNGVNQGSWQPIATEVFTNLLAWLKEKSDKKEVWVDTVANITRYMKERDNFSYKVISITTNQIEIETGIISTNLSSSNLSIFNYPLTVDITVPHDWKKVDVNQGSGNVTVSTFTNNKERLVRTDIIPGKDPIILSKK